MTIVPAARADATRGWTAGDAAGFSGVGARCSTVEAGASLDFVALRKSFASAALGTLSPPDSLRASVGGAACLVRYSRPSTRAG